MSTHSPPLRHPRAQYARIIINRYRAPNTGVVLPSPSRPRRPQTSSRRHLPISCRASWLDMSCSIAHVKCGVYGGWPVMQ